MKTTAERVSLVIRTLLLVICCTLFLPQAHQGGSGKSMDGSAIRAASMTLAITSISDPSSQLQNFANGERSALRGSGQRSGVPSSGKRTSISSPGKEDGIGWYSLDTDDDSAALPGLPPLPGSFSLCAKERFSFCALPPESHGHLHWYALAPPSSENV